MDKSAGFVVPCHLRQSAVATTQAAVCVKLQRPHRVAVQRPSFTIFASANSSSAATKPSAPTTSSQAYRAVIFDCDGVILESENLHREAYNQVFREFGVPYQWSEEYYDELQNLVGGGKPKMRYYFGIHGWPVSKLGPPPTEERKQTDLIDQLQDRKTEIYKEYITKGVAACRPGVLKLMDEAIQAKQEGQNLKLAICSASTKDSCLFVLENLLGKERLSSFDVVLAGDDVPKKKPDPMIYNVCFETMNQRIDAKHGDGHALSVEKENCIIVEDSKIGLQAATSAGMKCVITYTHSTKSQDFKDAVLVVEDLASENVTLSKLLSL